MVKKKEAGKKEELESVDVSVESGGIVVSDSFSEILCEEQMVQKLLKYYHGRQKSQIGIVKDDVILVLNVCRDVKDIVSELSGKSVDKISDLAFECLKVTADRDKLKGEYEDLASEYEDMKAEYEGLKEKFCDVVDESDSLKERVSSLERELSEKTLWRCLKEKFHFA